MGTEEHELSLQALRAEANATAESHTLALETHQTAVKQSFDARAAEFSKFKEEHELSLQALRAEANATAESHKLALETHQTSVGQSFDARAAEFSKFREE